MVSNAKKKAKKADSQKKPKKKKTTIMDHDLVPTHRILNEEETQRLLDEYDIKLAQLPKISSKDPMVKLLKDAEPGSVLEIKRDSLTAGKTNYYRVVLND